MGQVTVTLTGDDGRLLRALDRVIAKQQEVGSAGKAAGEQHMSAFDGASRSVEKMVAGLSAWGVALGAVKKGIEIVVESFDRLDKAREAAAGRVQSDSAGLARLSQVAGGDAGRFRTLAGEARRLASAEGVSIGNAADQVFQLERAGVTGSGREQLLTDLSRVGEDHRSILSAAALQRSFGRSTGVDALRGVLGGALNLKRPDGLGDFLESAAREAPYAARAGVSEEDFLGQLSSVAQSTGSSEKAARELKGLFEAAGKHPSGGLAGLMKRSDHALLKMVGGEGLAAERILSGGTQAANLSDSVALGRMGTLSETDPTVLAARMASQREADERGVLEPEGQERRASQGRVASTRVALRRVGLAPWAAETVGMGMEGAGHPLMGALLKGAVSGGAGSAAFEVAKSAFGSGQTGADAASRSELTEKMLDRLSELVNLTRESARNSRRPAGERDK